MSINNTMSFDFATFHQQADKALNHLAEDINQLRTGKASAQILDTVKAEAYGTVMKISELANVTVPDPNMIMISPWDKSLISSIEKAINSAGLNLNAVVDGQILRIVVPPLTEERRKEMVKLLHQKLEAGRVMLRSIRTDVKREIDKQKGQPGISEDAIEADLVELDKLAKNYGDTLEDLGKRKEADLLTI